MTAQIVMVTQDRPATPAELDNAADLIAGGYLDGTGNARLTKGTLWERVAAPAARYATLGDIANELRRMKADGMTRSSVLYAVNRVFWEV